MITLETCDLRLHEIFTKTQVNLFRTQDSTLLLAEVKLLRSTQRLPPYLDIPLVKAKFKRKRHVVDIYGFFSWSMNRQIYKLDGVACI